jgi:feruloyl-CoA synthase
VRATGQRVPILPSLGSTETTTMATLTWWPASPIGSIGMPPPGMELKLVPDGERTENRFKAPHVTPGNHGDAVATAARFDDEGWLRSGDAVSFVDRDDPLRGLVYQGRIAENFKLSSGTWVSVAAVRSQLLAHLHPYVREAVLTGQDGTELGALLFANEEQLARRGLTERRAISQVLGAAIRAYNARYPGSSTRIARALVLDRAPSIDGGELTDKGHVNQRAVLRLRADVVSHLHASVGDDDCMLFR